MPSNKRPRSGEETSSPPLGRRRHVLFDADEDETNAGKDHDDDQVDEDGFEKEQHPSAPSSSSNNNNNMLPPTPSLSRSSSVGSLVAEAPSFSRESAKRRRTNLFQQTEENHRAAVAAASLLGGAASPAGGGTSATSGAATPDGGRHIARVGAVNALTAAAAAGQENGVEGGAAAGQEPPQPFEMNEEEVRTMTLPQLENAISRFESEYRPIHASQLFAKARWLLRFDETDYRHDALYLSNQWKRAQQQLTMLMAVHQRLQVDHRGLARFNYISRINGLMGRLWYFGNMCSCLIQARDHPNTVSDLYPLLYVMRYKRILRGLPALGNNGAAGGGGPGGDGAGGGEADLGNGGGGGGGADDDPDAKLEKYKLSAEFYQYAANKAFEYGLRKQANSDYTYREKILEDGTHTRAWMQHQSIEEFVKRTIIRDELSDRKVSRYYQCFPRLPDEMVSMLQNYDDYRFPFFERSKSVFSFKNGLYLVKQGLFLRHSDPRVTSNIVACQYHDRPFPEQFLKQIETEQLRDEMYARDDAHEAWFDDVPTPAFDRILDHQRFQRDVKVINWVMMGRMLYWVGELDNWGVMPFYKGLAATGKSTILKVLMMFYAEDDVKALANNMEKQFGLMNVQDKYLILGFDVKKDFQLDQAQWQSMVSGEAVTISRKGKGTKDVNRFRSPMAFAGNALPGWADNSDSVARRFIMFLFNFLVTEDQKDTTLEAQLINELPQIIFKANRAYRSKVRLWKSDDIHKHLPKYFRETNQQLLADCHPLMDFLASDWVDIQPEYYTSEDEFITAFREYCSSRGKRGADWRPDLYIAPFQKLRLQIQRTARPYPPIYSFSSSSSSAPSSAPTPSPAALPPVTPSPAASSSAAPTAIPSPAAAPPPRNEPATNNNNNTTPSELVATSPMVDQNYVLGVRLRPDKIRAAISNNAAFKRNTGNGGGGGGRDGGGGGGRAANANSKSTEKGLQRATSSHGGLVTAPPPPSAITAASAGPGRVLGGVIATTMTTAPTNNQSAAAAPSQPIRYQLQLPRSTLPPE
jgi:uncharacterized membrane protein YgcG